MPIYRFRRRIGPNRWRTRPQRIEIPLNMCSQPGWLHFGAQKIVIFCKKCEKKCCILATILISTSNWVKWLSKSSSAHQITPKYVFSAHLLRSYSHSAFLPPRAITLHTDPSVTLLSSHLLRLYIYIYIYI